VARYHALRVGGGPVGGPGQNLRAGVWLIAAEEAPQEADAVLR
jgi:hypothetical protein